MAIHEKCTGLWVYFFLSLAFLVNSWRGTGLLVEIFVVVLHLNIGQRAADTFGLSLSIAVEQKLRLLIRVITLAEVRELSVHLALFVLCLPLHLHQVVDEILIVCHHAKLHLKLASDLLFFLAFLVVGLALLRVRVKNGI